MPNFIPLKELRERIWPLAVAKNIATDMTAVSLPIPDFSSGDGEHPYQVVFLLYYAVPSDAKVRKPNQITRPYALLVLDLVSGELVRTESLGSGSNPLVGPGVDQDVFDLPADDRRNLQNLFFARCDEAVQIHAAKKVSPGQADRLKDLLNLFGNLMEPPLAQDYETYGKPFLSWLKENAKSKA
jgi:hypothetical protein